MKKSAVSQMEIARACGCARSTVSYALNPRLREKLLPETRGHVLEMARQLGYRPNLIARSLVRQKTDCLAIMIPDQRNPVYSEITHGAIMEAEKEDYEVFVCSTEDNVEREKKYVERLLERRCDGVILMPIHGELNHEVFAALKEGSAPWVVIGDPQPGIAGDYISADFEEGARILTRHLLSLGRKRIAFLGTAVTRGLTETRWNGCRRALAEAGLEPRAVFCGSGMEVVYDKVREMFNQSSGLPDALLCMNDFSAIAACRAIEDCGLRVPADVGVAGFDDIPIGRYLHVPLTTVGFNVEQVGAMAVRMLFERLHQPDKPPQRVHLKPHLNIRASCGAQTEIASLQPRASGAEFHRETPGDPLDKETVP